MGVDVVEMFSVQATSVPCLGAWYAVLIRPFHTTLHPTPPYQIPYFSIDTGNLPTLGGTPCYQLAIIARCKLSKVSTGSTGC